MDEKSFKKKKESHLSLKKFMHPKNPYKTPPSFKKLAIAYPEFRKHCTYDVQGRVHLNFKDSLALKALTTSLLDKDFGLNVEIPENRLVPTLPLRFNYLLWIQDLLNFTYFNAEINQDKKQIIGYDIGTGASCIYPLLGYKKFKWKFIASEDDELSFTTAKKNILTNELSDHILLKKESSFFEFLNEDDVKEFITRQDSLLKKEQSIESPLLEQNNDYDEALIDFTMCNPPFFSSEEEMVSNNKSRGERSEPMSAPTGSAKEKVIEGGEVAFIAKMIEESVLFKDKIRLFTSMVGQKKNLPTIKKLLNQVNPSHFKVTEFCQGRTMRWGIAWTFNPKFRIDKNTSKKEKINNKTFSLVLPRTAFSICSVGGAWKKLTAWLKELKIKPNIFKSSKHFIGAQLRIYKRTWLHQRRKKREIARKIAQMVLSVSESPTKEVTQLEDQTENNKRKLMDEDEPLLPSKICKLSESQETDEMPPEDTPQDEPLESVSKTPLECILRCNLLIKQSQGMISLELVPTGGSDSKQTANSLMQYFRNRLNDN